MKGSSLKEFAYIARIRLARPTWWRDYKEAMSHEHISSDELNAINWRKRLSVLQFAFENSPFYNQFYRAVGLEPGDVKSEQDWEKIPILTRDDIRKNFDTIKVREPRGTYKLYTTGGSTGEPTRILKDDAFCAKILTWREFRWAGLRLGQNVATIMRAHPFTLREKLYQFVAHFPSKSIYMDSMSQTPATFEKFISEWRSVKPYKVNAYVGGAYALAQYCLEHKIELPIPAMIATTAAPCPDNIKEVLRKAFHAPIYDDYGGTEAAPMAGQCTELVNSGSSALHINSDYRNIESVDEAGVPVPTGELGDMLLTDLEDRVFPIIRYRMGDRVRLLSGKCSCGRPYPLMDKVRGRTADYIYLEKGRLSGDGWTMLFENCIQAVHGFQIHQHADKSVVLKVVLNKQYKDAVHDVEKVASHMRSQLGNIPLTIEYVDTIPHDRGKLKYIVSEVQGV